MFLLVLYYKVQQILSGLPNTIFPINSVMFQFCRRQGCFFLFQLHINILCYSRNAIDGNVGMLMKSYIYLLPYS